MIDPIDGYVREFHRAFSHPEGDYPHLLVEDREKMRLDLILEELAELLAALGYSSPDTKTRPGNLIEAADALGDLVYVIYGMAIEMGILLTEVVAEIHESNMTKLDVDGSPIYRADGKILKGPNYREPDLELVLFPFPEHTP